MRTAYRETARPAVQSWQLADFFFSCVTGFWLKLFLAAVRLEKRIGLASFDRSCRASPVQWTEWELVTSQRYYYTVDTKQKMFYSAITADLEVHR